MKRLLGLIILTILLSLGTRESEASPAFHGGFGMAGSVGFFYSSLSPYGEWIEIDVGYYGWRPLQIHRGWRPYMHGRWVWTDYGWYWVSSEPFGWAVYHYGRWYYDDYYGWIWIPDSVWGPAWVEWRYNDDYIGWAPLPPYARFSITIGIRFTTRWIAPVSYWTFVPYRHFTSVNIVRHTAPPEYTRRLIGVTRATARYEVERDRVINRGVDRNMIERRGNMRIERYEVAESRERGERLVRTGRQERIEVFRPDTRGGEDRDRGDRIEARRPERRISLDFERIERGERGEGRSIERRGAEGRQRMLSPQPPAPQQQEEERPRQRFTSPYERQFQMPAEQWRFERREPPQERSKERESVAPPQVRQRGGEQAAPQRKQGGADQSRSSGRERKRDND